MSKINLEPGTVVPVAQYPEGFCENGSDGSNSDFAGQQMQSSFSADFQKMVIRGQTPGFERFPGSHAGYYDVDKNAPVDVSQIVHPVTGDFSKPIQDSDGYFTDDDLFGFHDETSNDYKYFDTTQMKIVKVAKDKILSWSASAVQKAEAVTCDDQGLWLTKGGQYLRRIRAKSESASGIWSIAMEKVGASCDSPSTRITPPTNIVAAASDASGSTVVFLITSETGQKLYRANLSDPDNPTVVIEKLEGNSPMIVAWR